jgi:hypothetical protein
MGVETVRRYDKVKEVYDDVIDGITQNKEAWIVERHFTA